MKSVLISIQPYWVFLVIAKAMNWDIPQHKTIEVRKNYPKSENWNKKVDIYCSKNKQSFNQIPKQYQPLMKEFLGKVIGEFVCDEISTGKAETKEDAVSLYWDIAGQSCLSKFEFASYWNCKDLYAWHISNLKIYNKPKELSEFYHDCGENPYCDGCPAYYYESNENGTNSYCCSKIEGCKPLTRPPQSWCYVEEV